MAKSTENLTSKFKPHDDPTYRDQPKESQFQNNYFQRKNSSPQDSRIKTLQLKYGNKEETPDRHQRILERLALKNQNGIKNMYINSINDYQEAHTPEPIMDDDRYDSKLTVIVRDSSDVSDFKSKERRSRKDRSRDTKLTMNRPLSQNVEQSYSNNKKQVPLIQK